MYPVHIWKQPTYKNYCKGNWNCLLANDLKRLSVGMRQNVEKIKGSIQKLNNWRFKTYLNLNSSAHTGACPSWDFVLHVIASFNDTMQYWCNVLPGGSLCASQMVSSKLLSSFTVFDGPVFGLCFFLALPQNLDIASIHSFDKIIENEFKILPEGICPNDKRLSSVRISLSEPRTLS